MTRTTHALAALLLPWLPGCGCSDVFSKPLDACYASDSEAALYVQWPEVLTGTLVDAGELGGSAAGCGSLAHQFVIDVGGDLGRVRFAWEREGLDLSAQLVDGAITVDQRSTNEWAHGASFVVRDADGLALVVNGANSITEVDDTTIDFGAWRATLPSTCGSVTATGILVTTGDVATDFPVGTPAGITVGGEDVIFYPLSASRLGPDFHCTDASDTLNWAMVRPPA